MKKKIFIIPKNHEYIRQLQHHLADEGVEAVVLKPFHYSSFSNLFKMLYFRLQGCRIIHVHWLYIFPFSFVMKGFYYLCKVLGIKIVWEMHNILPHGYSEADIRSSKWFYEKSDGIIFHSSHDVERAKDTLHTKTNKRHIVIPHGNFNESYPNTVSRKDARAFLDIPDNCNVILCFGFIRENRGYEYLLEAVKNRENTVVIVAGKQQDANVYKMLVEQKKTAPQLRLFAKWIGNEEIQYYFNACDIVVLPYTDITTSGVIPLAYAFSKPVISTAIGGIQDIVNSETGILVSPKNAQELRRAIDRLFSMDRKTMGEKARAYAEREFNWKSNARKIRTLYEIIDENNTSADVNPTGHAI